MTRSLATPRPLAQACWSALGTSVVLRSVEPDALAPARGAVERELAAVDRACSRFRSDSELVRLNERAGRRVETSAVLFEALELALDAARLTDGDVDPTVGRALELAGYDRDWSLLAPAREEPTPNAPVLTLRAHAGWRTVELEATTRTVRVPAGIRLDLGATAKAWAADRAAAAAHAASGSGVLISLGGDIATAGAAPREGWRVRVTDDHRSDPSAPGQTISIAAGGLATSSTAVRRWSYGGHTMHHIIDPATGAPARSCWRTVSVAAADCAQANIATTAALIRARSAVAWLEQLGLPARLQDQDDRVVRTGAWPTPLRENGHEQTPQLEVSR
ncbi:MAG TPA: FAD:protein FMN transferase [Solirubrobacteraceae bacterium]|nr:FAD:protein FMN transferase [Solirubrobacteraceae bacterium]